MLTSRRCLFYLVTFICICFCLGSFHSMKCTETDRQALLKLKDGFGRGSDNLSLWKGEDCCKWEGISCDNLTGHITSLYLQASVYSSTPGGKIDCAVCELQHLTFLDLSFNGLEGKIPKCIGSLGQLTGLNLAGNKLVSDIPYNLGNLSNLQTLYLHYNYLVVANDIEWVSHLSNLRYLDLSATDLSQAFDWLSSISKIPSLSELHLDDCMLSQGDTKSIHHMNSSTSLKILSLSRNMLNSSFLSWVLNVSKVLTYLDLSYNSLQQSIPDGFANMISLRFLDLSSNELEGTIPKSFRSLCRLEELWLYSNKLSGRLSDNIKQLCCAQNSLELLDLNDNPLSSGPFPDLSCLSSLRTLSLRNINVVGPLPQSFGQFPFLAYLDLNYNKFSGSLPLFEVSKLPSLEELYLSHNQLNGTLPCTIGQLSNLRVLYISSNELNGVINESHFSNLSRLESLYVAKNSLSFNFSSNWVPPFQLLFLDASSCNLGPKFPTWLKHQRRLGYLQISDSGISKSFPKWFWNLSTNLFYLNVSLNKLSGALPKSLPDIETKLLNVWDFSFNNLSGSLPYFPRLYALFLTGNMFKGSASSICSVSPMDLTFLDVSSNLLSGPLPDCWAKFQSLRFLSLAKNNLSGTIPKSFGTLQHLQSMHLNNNLFSGGIPSLTHCSSLKFIDFGDNNLNGTVPSWIGQNLDNLIVLRLQANNIQGDIPFSLCNLSFLQVLDLSKNNITGEIPQCLSHLTALSNMTFPRHSFVYNAATITFIDEILGFLVDEAALAWKGEDREYGKILGLMTAIDLSCNHITGEIPQSISSLVALAVLNLSGNNLTGSIPNDIGDMEMLESLDLSRNHLYGRMPSSFSKLTFLSFMNLSFNNLFGKIPVSTQLQSFDISTYYGNNGLCGPPLIIQCPEYASPPTESIDKNETNEHELIGLGFYVSVGLGFCVGFWGFCGTLVIKSSWSRAYFQFLNNITDWIRVTIVSFAAKTKRPRSKR